MREAKDIELEAKLDSTSSLNTRLKNRLNILQDELFEYYEMVDYYSSLYMKYKELYEKTEKVEKDNNKNTYEKCYF